MSENNALKLPEITRLVCTFDEQLIDVIRNGTISLRQVKELALNSKRQRVTYSSLVSAGSIITTSENVNSFVTINLPDVEQITSGLSSIVALTTQGYVYGRGSNACGELALGDTKSRNEWTIINGFPCAVKQVSCQCEHSLFLTVDGQIFSCGNNEYGQLVCGLVI